MPIKYSGGGCEIKASSLESVERASREIEAKRAYEKKWWSRFLALFRRFI